MADDCAFGNFQVAANVPNPAAVKGLFINLRFYARFPGIVVIVKQETFPAAIAPVALSPFWVVAVLD